MKRPKKQVNFRIEPDLWQAFVTICQMEDTTAGRELRRFIRQELARKKQMELPGPKGRKR